MPAELLPSEDELTILSLPAMAALAARCARLTIPTLQKEWPDLPEKAATVIDMVIRSVEKFEWGGWSSLDQIRTHAPTERAAQVVDIATSATYVLQTAYSGLMAERTYGTSSKGHSSVLHLLQLIDSCVEIDPSLCEPILSEYERVRCDERLTEHADPVEGFIEVRVDIHALYSPAPTVNRKSLSLGNDWMSMSRLYIASQDEHFLHLAINSCDYQQVREVLVRLDNEGTTEQTSELMQTVCDGLRQEEKHKDAVLIETMFIARTALELAGSETTEDTRRSLAACEQIISACREWGFLECEARFAFTLGSKLAEVEKHEEALLMLRYASTVFELLSTDWPVNFVPLLANTLSNIGTVVEHQSSADALSAFNQAQRALERLGDGLADDDAHLYVHILEGVARGVDGSAGPAGALPHYEAVLSEYRRLAEKHPGAVTHVARVLNIVSSLNKDTAINDLDRAGEAKEEALAILLAADRELEHDYLPAVAMTRMGLGVLREECNDLFGALACLETARSEWRRVADRHPQLEGDHGLCCQLIAEVLMRCGRNREAREKYELALESWRTARKVREDSVTIVGFRNTAVALAQLLREQGKLEASNDLFVEASSLEREFALTPAGVEEGAPETLVDTLNERSIGLRDAGRLAEAEESLNEALSYTDHVDDRASTRLLELRAQSLTNLFAVLSDRRLFSLAGMRAYEGLEVYRFLASRAPDKYDDDVAMSLRNLTTVSDPEDAIEYAMKSVAIRRALVKRGLVSETRLAGSLEALAISAMNNRKHGLAVRSVKEALRLRKSVPSDKMGIIYCLYLMGGVHYELADFASAKSAVDEAAELSGGAVIRGVRHTGVLAALHDLRRRVTQATTVHRSEDEHASEAISHAERWTGDRPLAWLGRGMTTESYETQLASLARQNAGGQLLSSIAALRDGVAIGEVSERVTAQALSEVLGAVASRVGRRIRVLLVQSLGSEEVLLGELGDGDPPFRFLVSSAFAAAARVLSADMKSWVSGQLKDEVLGLSAKRAWDALPDSCQDILLNDDSEVLISADSSWADFPWEALRSSKEIASSIGLRRSLARWDSLLPENLVRLEINTFGSGNRAAAVVAPWDADPKPEQLLPHSRDEAEAIARLLSQVGFKLLPDGQALIGKQARSDAMVQALSGPLAMFHFSGHSLLTVNDEVLKVHSIESSPQGFFLREAVRRLEYFFAGTFSVQNIYLEKTRLRKDRLLSSDPLVVLNCCNSGRRRAFGGRSEDLASTFINEGALGVVSVSTQPNDAIGEVAGKALYDPVICSQAGMGEVTRRVRRLLYDIGLETRDATLHMHWMSLRYHGNPFTRLPILADMEHERACAISRDFFEGLGSAFSLPTDSSVTRTWMTDWPGNQ